MSISPLPVHISCFGISSDAVTMARGYSKPSTYGDRLATVKASASAAVPGISSKIQGSVPSGGSVPAAAPSPTRQAPQVKLQPIPTETAQQYLTGSVGGANTSGGSPGAPSSSPTGNLAYRSHTKHNQAVAAPLQAIDFISIAVNSVGGGGVPRPYGKFTACRKGDGNATWERLPPPPGSWQAKALPIAVTLLGDAPPGGAGMGPRLPPGGPNSHSGAVAHASSRSLNPHTEDSRGNGGDVAGDSGDADGGGSGGAAAAASGGCSRGSEYVTPVEAINSPRNLTSGQGSMSGLRLGFTSPERTPQRQATDGHAHIHGHGQGQGRARHGRSESSHLSRATYPGPGHGRANGAAFSAFQPGPRGGGGGSTLRRSTNRPAGGLASAPAAGAGGGIAARLLHEQSYYRRPGSSLHRSLVPLPPPEPNNLAAWFALPAATFLAEVPTVPEALRMDNGYSVSRDFLMSGLNPPRAKPQPGSPPRSPPRHPPAQHPHPQPQAQPQPGEPDQPDQQPQPHPESQPTPHPQPDPTSDSPSSSGPYAAYMHPPPHPYAPPPPSDRQLQEPDGPRAQSSRGYHHPQPELRVGDRRTLWEALEKGGQVQSQGHTAPAGSLGLSRLRGVYVPLDRRGVVGGEGQEGTGAGYGPGSGSVSGYAYEANPGLLAGGGGMGGSMSLPPEMALPRRNVPAGW